MYYLPNIIRVIKSRRMKWMGYVACTGDRRGAYRVLVGKHEGKRPLGRPRHSWEDILKWIFKKWNGGGGAWTALIWLGQGQVTGYCAFGNKPLDSIQFKEILD
jgi:hypothetical protein